jgi:glycosyltransferase involved in cell wall biosynthesis
MSTLETPHPGLRPLGGGRLAALREGAGRSLHVAVVAPPWYAVPPEGYGGIESMLAGLIDGLVARGHRVTLIGAGRHRTRAQRFVSVYETPPSDRLGEPLPEVVHAAAAAKAIDDLAVDVVHDNTLAGPLTARGRGAPTVLTTHGAVTGEAGRYLADLGSSVSLVAISEAQRKSAPGLNWVGRVHNSVDVGSFPVGRGEDGYLLFLGRFCPTKGAHLAIDAAAAAGVPIVLAGKLSEPPERAYFEEMIRPRLGPGACYVGEADAAMKRELYGAASALLFPICWDEPFGLVMVEAMACGTPVVALARGSVPEVVVDGATGFVVRRPEELVGAIRRIPQIDRAACRRHVAAHFDLPSMVDGYEKVFRQVAAAAGASPSGSRSGARAGTALAEDG